jgi:hypothetical protein
MPGYVNKLSDYEVEGRNSIPDMYKAFIFVSASRQLWVRPASYLMGTGACSPLVKPSPLQ